MLGTHVRGRPKSDACRRDPLARDLAGRVGNAEVGHDGAIGLKQNVLGLDVAVDHARRVRVVQRVSHVGHDLHRKIGRKCAVAIEPCAQAAAGDERHDVVRRAVGDAGIEQRQNVRVLEARRDLDLLAEPPRRVGRQEFGSHHLHRDQSAVAEIIREIHDRHSALADRTRQSPAISQLSSERSRQLVHERHLVVGFRDGSRQTNVECPAADG